MTRDNTFLEPTFKGTHVSITNTLHNAKREQGLTVTSARLPPSLPRLAIRHHLRSSPVGLGTSTRLAQVADSLHSVVLHHGDQLSTDQKRVLRPAGRTSELGSRHQNAFLTTMLGLVSFPQHLLGFVVHSLPLGSSMFGSMGEVLLDDVTGN